MVEKILFIRIPNQHITRVLTRVLTAYTHADTLADKCADTRADSQSEIPATLARSTLVGVKRRFTE